MVLRVQLQKLALLCLLCFAVNVQAKNSKCSNPSVRREWRALSKKDQAEWINAVKCLGKLPHDPALKPTGAPNVTVIPPVNPSSSFWDDINYMHMDLNPVIHWTGFFLPWHRAYVWGLEQAMKSKCGYKGAHPYWDWTQDAADFFHGSIFDDDPETGFGGWGDPNNDYQITTGAFAKDFTVAYPVPHTIRRNFTLQPLLGSPTAPNPALLMNTTMTKANAEYLVNNFVGDFRGFHTYFESIRGLHPGAHLIMGGDMAGDCPAGLTAPACVEGPKWTPNDPMFFMHHTFVDKLWFDWQSKDESSFYSYFGGSVSTRFNPDPTAFATFPTGAPPFLNYSSVIPNDGLLWDKLTIWDVMDTTGDHLCYVYE